MTQEQEQLVISLFLEGKSKSEIGRIIKVDRHTVDRLLKKKQINNVNKIQPNQRFGKLTTIEPTDERDNCGRIKWLCRCDCGNITKVASSMLKNGSTQSCGCSRVESVRKINFIDLTNQRFGKLTVINETPERKNGSVMWKCKCDCGNEILVSSNNLIQGYTKSCGCLQSYGEYQIELLLKQFNITYIHQYSFNDLKSRKNWPLRFDFAIFKNNEVYCLIEYQGIQHYDKNNNFHTEELEYNDLKKIKYCEENGYTLILINKIQDIKNIIESLVSKIND